MARLPDPVLSEVEIVESQNNDRKITFYKMIGQAIRKAEIAKKKGGKGKDETD